MKCARIKSLVMAAVIACAMGVASQASALSSADSQYLGLVVSGEPASPTDEVGYINTLVGLAANTGPVLIAGHTYTTSSNNCATCPVAVIGGAVKVDSPTSGNINVTGFTYLLLKYDGPNGGDEIYDVRTLSNVTVSLSGPAGSQFGLSHYSLYNPTTDGSGPPTGVPEPSTLLLLGTGLAAVARFARKRK